MTAARIACPYTYDAIRAMLPVFPSDETIARRVSNSAYIVTPAQVRAVRCSVPRRGYR